MPITDTRAAVGPAVSLGHYRVVAAFDLAVPRDVRAEITANVASILYARTHEQNIEEYCL